MHKKIIIAAYGATGKTVFGNKYSNAIDLESSKYKWDNTGYEKLKEEERKGIARKVDDKWPDNYHQAIVDALDKYDIVLTSTHEHVLKFLEEKQLPYYLAIPTLDSIDEITDRCIKRGNNKTFIDILIKTLYYYDKIIDNYNPVKVLRLNKNEYLEDKLKKELEIKELLGR